MAATVVWSPFATDDVVSIAEYIAQDSPAAAASVVRAIVDATKKLSRFPTIGRVVPESKTESFREIFAYDYRIIYRVQAASVLIVTVIHGKRQLPPL